MIIQIKNLLKQKNLQKFFGICFSLGIALIAIDYRLFEKPGLFLGDEFGYMATPAYLCGFDWSEQICHIGGYYGVGYGILMIPGFWFCKTVQQMTLYILIVNIILYSCSVILSFILLSKILGKENYIKISICTIVVSLYISNICYIQIAWSETATLVLYWLTLNLLYDVIKGEQTKKIVALALTLCYSVMVHMRNIIMVIACIFVLGIWLVKRRQARLTKLAIFAITVFIGIIVFFLSKNYILKNLYQINPNTPYVNGAASVVNIGINHLKSFGILTVIKKFFISMIGKMFYFISSTYGMIVFGIAGAGIYIKEQKNDENKLVVICSGLIFLFSWLLCAYTMMTPGRLDGVVYGRYMDSYIGLLIVFGVVYLSSTNFNGLIKTSVILFSLYKIAIVLSERAYSELLTNSVQGFVFQCSTGIAKFYLSGDLVNIIDKVCRQTLFIVVVLHILCFFICFCKKYLKKFFSIIPITIIATVLLTIWVKDSRIVVAGVLNYTGSYYKNINQVVDASDNKSIMDYIDNNWSENGNPPVYYYGDQVWPEPILVLQYELGKTPIIEINSLDAIEKNACAYILLHINDEYILKANELKRDNFHYCCSTNEFALYSK